MLHQKKKMRHRGLLFREKPATAAAGPGARPAGGASRGCRWARKWEPDRGRLRVALALLPLLLFASILLPPALTPRPPVEASTGSLDAANVVKIGILPDVDSFPFIVAQELGFFKDAGVNVKLIPFQNPIERDSALQARAIDGEVADTLAAVFARTNGLDVKITSITNGRYAILTSPKSNIKSLHDLKNVPIGLSTNTIIEYITDQLLAGAGLPAGSVAKIAIPKIPIRLQMLESGKIKAACLPEPLATVARLRGASLIADSDSMGLAPGVMIFTADAIKRKTIELRRLYEAYDRAITKINKDPGSVRHLLVEKAGFPEIVRDVLVFPHYHRPSVPAPGDVEKVLNWMIRKELIDKDQVPAYQDLVTDTLIKDIK
ncbi:MAG TPA: ABC transporter substrate-binding protein [Firmicutes bacterium]|nr:ABC transporter substrate-binding protein [Bacillota bacterium]